MTDDILFFGFGMFVDRDMMLTVTGRQDILGVPVTLEGFRLGIQEIVSIPELPQRIIRNCWGPDGPTFKSYVVAEGEGKVIGVAWLISKEDLKAIEAWELVPEGWTIEVERTVILPDGKPANMKAIVLPIPEERKVDRFVDGEKYPPYLMPKERFVEIITRLRAEGLLGNKVASKPQRSKSA